MMDKTKMGVVLFLGSEAFFFLMLILAFVNFNYGGASVDGPTAASSLDLPTAAIFTVFLLASSGTLWLAERSLAQARLAGLRLWLLATVLLGAVFLAGQAWEYWRLIGENVTIGRNLFGATFFTLTGFHGLHVFSGLVALAILLGLAQAGWFRGPHAVAIEAVGWYWHFVDVVWVIIFTLIYVGPRL